MAEYGRRGLESVTPDMGVFTRSRKGQRMALALEDRLAVGELIALHGHLVDGGELHRSAEVFTPDVVYDLSDFGQGQVTGLAALIEEIW